MNDAFTKTSERLFYLAICLIGVALIGWSLAIASDHPRIKEALDMMSSLFLIMGLFCGLGSRRRR